MKYQYVAIPKTTYVPKIRKFFVVCLTTRHTLKDFRLKRQYLSLAAERMGPSDRSIITFILTVGVRLRHLPKTNSKNAPEGVRLRSSSLELLNLH